MYLMNLNEEIITSWRWCHDSHTTENSGLGQAGEDTLLGQFYLYIHFSLLVSCMKQTKHYERSNFWTICGPKQLQ